MEYRILGKTGLKVSRMGFGGIPIQRIDAEGTKVLIHRLMEAGVNYIDTARAYTVSESYLGYALEGIREKFVIATKSMARTREAMARDIDISLQNLRTDYIDLYQVHNPNAQQLEQVTAPGGALEALLEAKAAGKIGHIGLTLHYPDLLDKAMEMDWVETLMFPYNVVETQGEKAIRKCGEKNIGFIDMKPFAGGAIDDVTTALRFVLSNPHVTITIPGVEKPEQIDQNLAAAENTTPLSPEEKNQIAAIRSQLGQNFCRRCNYCAPCAAGINIPNAFTAQGYVLRYGLRDFGFERYRSMEKRASDCIGCGACEDRCPYHLPIRQMLKQVAQVFGE